MRAEVLNELMRFISYDPFTGIFTWVERRWRVNAGDIAGHINRQGYVCLRFNRKQFPAHRLAWMLMNGEIPHGKHIDHINGDKSDNRIVNLRLATASQNAQNQRNGHKGSKTGLLGSSYHKDTGKYQAQIQIAKKVRHIGLFDTPEEAHAAYLAEKRKTHVFCKI